MKKAIWRNIKKNHFIMMIICCAAPLVAISVMASSGILGSWGYYAIFLLCPLLHVFMMRKHSSSHENNIEQTEIAEEPMKDRVGGE